MTREPTDILDELRETFQTKNDDYADTWVVTGMALSALHDGSVRLETDRDHLIDGNVHRVLDKILRGYNAAVIKDDVNHEAAVDSFEDAAVYCAMIASALGDDQTSRIDGARANMLGGDYTTKETVDGSTLHVRAHDPNSGHDQEVPR